MPERRKLEDAIRDRYVVEHELGRGGFAVVYLARDVRHDRRVALKVLHEEVASAMGTDRFEREIRLAARLQHPHILGVFDSGDVDGRLWFAMPFVEGETLRARMQRERQLPVGDALRIAREVAEALEYAHSQGVLHRDIKPENILLTGRHAMVADFGIARAIVSDAPSITQTGMSLGTPGYMSPEQAMGGGEIDARSDVFALGCVLYEMLAGEPAFDGPNAQSIVARLMTEDPRPLATIRPNLPPMVEPTLRKAMARVPADRYPSAAAFVLDIEQLSAGASTPTGAFAPTATRPSIRRFIAVSVMAVLLFVGGFLAWKRSSALPEDKTPRLAVLPFESIGVTEDDATFAEGITEELRGKLSGVPGLRVIARASSNQYRRSAKSVHDIGGELGVQYLLTGTVRWSGGANGSRRVRVTPELILVRDGSTQWQQSFDDDLQDVFKVQSAIATNVTGALDVALSAAARAQLARAPTSELSAYQEFLKGDQATDLMSSVDFASLKAGLAHYERAAALDSNYAAAWARIAMVHSFISMIDFSRSEGSLAHEAVAKAARLAPGDALTLRARAQVTSIFDKDIVGASALLDSALRRSPNNVDLLIQSAKADAALSRYDSAIVRSRRAARLDPRNPAVLHRLARTLHVTRHYAESDSTWAQLLAISPGNISGIEARVINFVSMGDTAGVARTVSDGLAKSDTTELLAYFAQFQEMMWTLPVPLQRRLTTLTPAPFHNNRQQWALKVGRMWALLGDESKARAYGDTAVKIAEAQLSDFPEDAQIHELLGRSLVLAGRKQEAIDASERSLKMRETALDASTGPYVRYQVARVLIQAGAYDRALDLIEPLLGEYYSDLTPAWLRLEPTFKPLKGNPRFERLTAK
jgi:serine/threonine protein kinase/tetratricopeptide (TPR) repeat protein